MTPRQQAAAPTAATIGAAIRRIRQFNRVTQADLADAAGLTRPHLCQLENGHFMPAADTVARLAAALGATTDALLASHLPRCSAHRTVSAKETNAPQTLADARPCRPLDSTIQTKAARHRRPRPTR